MKTVVNITNGQTVAIPGPQGAMGIANLGPIGNAPNADGATLAGNLLNLEPCDGTFGGVISDTTQDIPGEKNFKQTVNTEGNFNLPATTSTTSGCLTMNDLALLHNYPFHLASTFLGFDCGNFSNSGGGNIAAAGFGALKNLTDGTDNSAIGSRSGENLTSSDRCTLLGYGAGRAITSGCDSTICIGNEAGLNLVNNSDNCIMIGNTGTFGDQKTIKVGTVGTHTSCYLQGITGTTGTDEMICVQPTTGKLGKRAILSVGTIGASPNANGATISSQVLTLQPANASNGGIIANATQTIPGAKTFAENVTCSKSIYLPAPDANGDGAIYTGGNRLIQEWSTSNLFVGRAGNLNANSTCVGIGLGALSNINGGYFCTAIGVGACSAATSANTLTAVGRSALIACTTGVQNIEPFHDPSRPGPSD